MARRRVNTKFLIILTVAVIGVGLSALVIHKLRRGDPAKYVKTAQSAFAQQHYEEAAKNYGHAVSIDARTPDVWVAYGDTLLQLIPKDPDNGGRALRAWQTALELDPHHKEALSRVLTILLADSETRGANTGKVMEQARDVAARLAKVDPTNKVALSAPHLLTIRGASQGMQTDPERIAEAAQQLVDLSTKHPEDVQLVSYATQAKIVQAQAVARTKPEDARKLLDEVAALMQASLKAAPNSAAMQFQAFQVFGILTLTSPPGDVRKQHEEAAKAAIAEAFKLAKPEDEQFGAIHMTHANQLRATDRAAAEKVAREALAAKPNDPTVRLNVAQILAQDPAKRREAIGILEAPLPPQPVVAGRHYAAKRAEVETLLALINLRLDDYSATPDAAARAEMHPKIEDGLSKLITRVSGGADHPVALKLRGKYQRLRGEHVAAIQSLNKALTLLEQQQATRDPNYLETMDLLAKSYVDTQQYGPARELLNKIVTLAPGHLPTRLVLARLLLQEKNPDAAKPHIDILEKQLPDAPEVIRLRIATLDRDKDKEQISALYARLPETTPVEMREKSNVALALNDGAEAERLLNALLAQTPGDPEVSLVLARHLASRDMRDKANAVIADALKVHPRNQQLQLTQKQLANASPEELRQFRMESIEQLTDPTLKSLRLAEVAMQEGKSDEALKHLQDAEKTGPDNMRVKVLLLEQYVARDQWNDASRYVEALAKANHDQAGGLMYRVRYALARALRANTPAERQAEIERAQKYGADLTQQLPEFGQSWLSYGQALQAAGKPQEAAERFATALEKQPDSFDAMRGLVETYSALGRSADVKRIIEMALRLNPNHPYFVEQQTTYELTQGDPMKALPRREEALKKDPDNPAAWGLAAQAYIATWRARSAKQDQAGAKEMLTKAFNTFKEAMAKFPDDRRFYTGYIEAAWLMNNPAAVEAAIKQLAAREAWKDKPEPQLMMADFLARSGKPDESEQLLRQLVTKYPKEVDVQLALVSLLTQRGKIDDAIAALQRNGDDPRVRNQLVELQIALGKLEEAEKTIQAALAVDPTHTAYQALAGYVSMRRGMWDEADKRLQAALKLNPTDPVVQYYLGLLRLRQPAPNIDEAVQRLTSARDAQPNANLLVEIRTNLASALTARNDLEAAARELELALQAQPNNKRLRMDLINLYLSRTSPRFIDAERTIREGRELAKNDLDLLRLEAQMWVRRKDNAKAIAAARQAVALAPQNPQVSYQLLEILVEAGDYAAAIKEADQMIAADKNRWWAHMFRGVAKRYAGDKDGAIQSFEAALTTAGAERNEAAAQEVIDRLAKVIGVDDALMRILPLAQNDNRWRIVAAQLYGQKGNHEGAVEMIERVLAESDKLSPQDRAHVLGLAGQIYLAHQPQPLAEKAYDAYLKLLDLQPNDLFALNNMASLLSETMNPPRYKEALTYSQKAYDLLQKAGRRNEVVLDTHGWVLTLNGRPQEGIDLLRQAIAGSGESAFPYAHYHLGEAYLKTAAPEDAQKQLEIAAEQIRQKEEKKEMFDPILRSKVEAALAKAKESVRSKSAAATP